MRILLFILLLVLPTSLSAIELSPEQEAIANEIFSNEMSPFCPGRLISDCPSTSATELKDKIREKILAGQSVDQIESYLFSVYGEQLRAAPEAKGFGLLAWIAPFGFLFLGLIVMSIWLQKQKKEDAPPSISKISKKQEQEIDDLLDQ
ncbi:MAG: cytochrome c-type biogenesis protein [bacterium]|nr:cytochrome c-type biogenesis protein [bacterium]